MRGDDAFGTLVLGALREKVAWDLVDSGETPENDMGRVVALGPEAVLLLDAAKWGAAPGTVAFFPAEYMPYGGFSTHALSLRLLADLLAERAGCPVGLLGIEPKSTGMCEPVSSEVEAGVERVVGEILRIADLAQCGDRGAEVPRAGA